MKRLPNDCFALPPGVDWIPVEDALAQLRARLALIAGAEPLSLIGDPRSASALTGRILAEDAHARRAHPAVDNAAVDGYAFAHPDNGAEMLDLALRNGRSAAGRPWDGVLAAGEALRILTGAAMPVGADTVVLQEDVEIEEGRIRFPPPRKPGANRRLAGENLNVGDRVASAGASLTPQLRAHLTASGVDSVSVRKKLRVALISTGDELVELSAAASLSPADAAKVVDSNRPMLAELLAAMGCEALDLGVVRDERAAVEAALDQAAAEADVAIATGGASGGDEDHMSRALAQAAARATDGDAFHLWRIAIKPGRPLAMGLRRGVPIFGLPGNPVAAFVCFLIFVRPSLSLLAGAGWRTARPLRVPVGFDFKKKPGRREFLRVRLGEDGRLEKFRSEGSGLIEGLVWADGLVDLAHDAGPIAAGEVVDYLPFASLGAPL